MRNIFTRANRRARGWGARAIGRSSRPRLERLEGRDLPAVLAPTGVAAVGASGSAIRVSWNASPDPTVTGYDVYEQVWVVPPHGGKGSPGGGHYMDNLVAANLKGTSVTLSGYANGTSHTYLVTALSGATASLFSLPATGETWVAPSFPNGPNTVLLGSGALWSGAVPATVGQTTQISLLISGNPLSFSVLSGPPTVTVNRPTGVVDYTPTAGDVGSIAVTIQATGPLGTVTQTITFAVAAANPHLLTPTLVPAATSAVYNGAYQQPSAVALGAGGVAVAGTYAVAYNGTSGAPMNVGTYQELITFTSADPRYSNATLLMNFTITPATPGFHYLTAPAITAGTSVAAVTGYLSAGTAVPTGDYVIITLGTVTQEAPVSSNGAFAASFNTAGLPARTYPVTFSFPGDANFTAATNGAATLTVVPPQAPTVTANPKNVTTTAGDGAVFTANATGSPVISVRWQVSADGGKTWTNVTGNTSALTNTLVILITNLSENGYKYRAVFTNSAGTATTTAATLRVQSDSGGD
jgi:hypothetical protein